MFAFGKLASKTAPPEVFPRNTGRVCVVLAHVYGLNLLYEPHPECAAKKSAMKNPVITEKNHAKQNKKIHMIRIHMYVYVCLCSAVAGLLR